VSGPRWRLEEADGVRLMRCAAFDAIPRVAHAFSTRLAFGRADFDLGPVASDALAPVSRCAAFLRAAGLGNARPAFLTQVHGGVIVNASLRGERPPAADGSIWSFERGAPGAVPVVRTADCVAVLFVDRHARAVAAVHAGWKGAAAGIGANAVARFAAEGVASHELVVAMGPAILGCCYEVGEDVVAALGAACGARSRYVTRTDSGRLSVDLHAAVRSQLVAAGVPLESIHAAPWCTRCRPDLFFSFRGEGPAAGRLMAAVGPVVGP